MTYFAGNHNVVNLGNKIKVWAEHGLVHVEDMQTGHYEAMHWKVAAERVAAIHDFNGKRIRSGSKKNAPESQFLPHLERDLTFVERVVEVIRQAKEQGSYDDPSMVKDRIRRLPISIRVGVELPKSATKRMGEFPA